MLHGNSDHKAATVDQREQNVEEFRPEIRAKLKGLERKLRMTPS